MRPAALFALALMIGCPAPSPTGSDTDADTDSDTDADTDSDTDADSDTDTDADSDTDTGPQLEDCADGIDNDNDGALDCVDYDCLTSPDCAHLCPAEDAFEDNDSVGSATPGIEYETDLMVHLQDPDFFQIDVPAGGIGRANIWYDGSIGDIDLQLLDATGAAIDLASGSGNTKEVYQLNDSGADTTWTVRVYHYTDGYCGSYDIALYGGEQPLTELCDTRADDDLDGAQNCSDYDCINTVECPECPAEDALDPNDTQATAVPVTGAQTDLLVHTQSPDWYRQVVPAGEMISFGLTHDSTDAPIRITLFDEADQAVATDSGTDDLFIGVLNGATEQQYTIKVEVDGICNSYDLTPYVGPTPPEICDDNFDNDLDGIADCGDYECLTDPACVNTCPDEDGLEPNDDFAHAFAGVVGTFSELSVHTQNPDWYTFEVDPGDVGIVSLQFAEADDLNLFVYDDTENLVTSSTSTTPGEGIRIENASPVVATYKAAVRTGGLTSCASYDLDIYTGSSPTEELCANSIDDDADGLTDCEDYACIDHPWCASRCAEEDIFEPNDTATQALLLEEGANLTIHKLNEDWFRIIVPDGNIVSASIEHTDAIPTARIDLELYDANGTLLGSNNLFNRLKEITSINDTGAAAEYRMRVHVWDASPSPCETYHFRLQSHPVPAEICDDGIDNDLDAIVDCDDYSCVDDAACAGVCPTEDALEPNNSQPTAYAGVSGTIPDLSVHQQNEDWFAVNVGPQQTAVVTVDIPSLDPQMRLELYDATGHRLLTSPANALQQQLTYNNLTDQPEELAARVSLGQAAIAVCSTYQLTVDVQDIPDELCTDAIDNDLDGATDCDDYDCLNDASCVNSCPSEDGFEDNDTQADAFAGLSGTITNLMVHTQDPDWFAISVDAGELVQLSSTFVSADGNIDLRLYDGDGVLLESSTTSNDHEELTYLNTTGLDQTVYAELQIGAGAGSCNTYDLTVYSGPIPDEICDDALDNDLDGLADCLDYDCIEAASCAGVCPEEDVLGVHASVDDALTGNTDFPNLSVHPQVPDFFRVEIPPGTVTNLDVSFVGASGNIDLVVTNELGWVLLDTNGPGDVESFEAVNDYSTPSIVYVEVHTDTCNSYDWAHTSTALVDEDCTDGIDNDNDGFRDCADAGCGAVCGCPSDDALEPNDTPPDATHGLFSATSLITSINNGDYFSYTVDPGQTLESTVTYDTAAGGDIDLYLYGATGSLRAVAITNDPTETLTWTNTGTEPESVTLLAGVRLGSAVPCNSYDIETTVH